MFDDVGGKEKKKIHMQQRKKKNNNLTVQNEATQRKIDKIQIKGPHYDEVYRSIYTNDLHLNYFQCKNRGSSRAENDTFSTDKRKWN